MGPVKVAGSFEAELRRDRRLAGGRRESFRVEVVAWAGVSGETVDEGVAEGVDEISGFLLVGVREK